MNQASISLSARGVKGENPWMLARRGPNLPTRLIPGVPNSHARVTDTLQEITAGSEIYFNQD